MATKNQPATGTGGKYNFPNTGLKRLEDDDEKRVFIGKALSNILAVSRAFEEPVKTEEELCERLNWFFETCANTNQLPTVEKMCLAIGYDRVTVWDWINGRHKSSIGEQAPNIIKKAKNLIASLDAELAQEGKIQPVVYMFRAKNFYGMADKQEIVVTPNSPLGDSTDPATIAQKYAELPGD